MILFVVVITGFIVACTFWVPVVWFMLQLVHLLATHVFLPMRPSDITQSTVLSFWHVSNIHAWKSRKSVFGKQLYIVSRDIDVFLMHVPLE